MVKPKVVFFQRKPYPLGNYSLEFIFSDLRARLNGKIDAHVSQCRFYSQGILRRTFNILEAIFKQGDVNIITGDVHFISFFLKKRKTILVIADCGFLSDTSWVKRFFKKLFWLTIPVQRVSRIVTISEHVKNEIVLYSKCDPSLVTVIPVSIDTKFTHIPQVFNKKNPTLLQIGQALNKNVARMIEAIKDMPMQLSIIGKVSEENQALLEQYNINFVSAYNLTSEEVLQKYKESDMLIFCSLYEGFGMPILEAQAMGRPVVTSDAASMPWVAGNAACLVDPLSVESIRTGIQRVVEEHDYRETLLKKGLENVKRFSPDVISGLYLEVIKKTYHNCQ